MSAQPEVIWLGDQSDAPDPDQLGPFETDSPFVVIPSWTKDYPESATDWSSLVEYQCNICESHCINRADYGGSELSLCRSHYDPIAPCQEALQDSNVDSDGWRESLYQRFPDRGRDGRHILTPHPPAHPVKRVVGLDGVHPRRGPEREAPEDANRRRRAEE